ncbi:MAG: 50S ribosomal protein L4, partial [Halobacteriaceae archaeon]
MTTPVYNLDGEEADEIDLPSVFTTKIREDLIKRAFLAATANAKQPYGSDEYAGLRTSAESPGSGRGMAHVPRANGEGARVPQAVGGRKAHPPKAEKDQSLEVNDKERRQAIRSAIAATGDGSVVTDRGHEFDEDVDLPVILSNDFEDVVKTQEVVDILETLGL